jgi:hypothetical protein
VTSMLVEMEEVLSWPAFTSWAVVSLPSIGKAEDRVRIRQDW